MSDGIESTEAVGLPHFRTFTIPPPGFDVRHASERELLAYGLPRRPDPVTHPALAAHWDRVAARQREFIRPELRPLYPPHWRKLSSQVRFERAGGKCQRCGRPHLARLRCLPDGRWFDEKAATWRDRRGRPARWPDLMEVARLRTTRTVLAAAHLDNDPTNNRLRNLRALCHCARRPQPCHLHKIRPSGRAPWAVTPRRCFFVEPPPIRKTAKASQVRTATP